MAFRTHTINDYNDRRAEEVLGVEGTVAWPYVDPIGIATIGVGINLRVHGFFILQLFGFDVEGEILPVGPARDAERGYALEILTAFANLYAYAGLSQTERTDADNAARTAVNEIMARRAADEAYANIPDFPRPATMEFASDTEADDATNSLFEDDYNITFGLDDALDPDVHIAYENIVDNVLPQNSPLRNRNSLERIALVSMAFNGGAGIFQGSGGESQIHRALRLENRAEVWFQIRYQSNKKGNLGRRRYGEAELFGLYNNDPQLDDYISAYRMYTRHRNDTLRGQAGLLGYESLHAPPAGVGRINAELEPARAAIGAEYNFADVTWDRIFIGGSTEVPGYGSANDVGTSTLRGTNDGADLILGLSGNDRLEGLGGNDVLVGGTGDDTLVGGAGDDRYVFNTGDGSDTIAGNDDEGSLVYDGVTVTGANATAVEGQTSMWSNTEGGQTFFYRMVGGGTLGGTLWISRTLPTDQTVEHIEIENFQSTNLGIILPIIVTSTATTLNEASALQVLASLPYAGQAPGTFLRVTASNFTQALSGVLGAETKPFTNGYIDIPLGLGQTQIIFSLLSTGDIDGGNQPLELSIALHRPDGSVSDPSTLDLTFAAVDEAEPANPITGNTIEGDREPQVDGDGVPLLDQWGNIIPAGGAAGRSDRLNDTPANDLILGLGGNDDLGNTSRGGDDILDGGGGDDELNAGGGNDHLIGGLGVDVGRGNGGNDLIELNEDQDFGYGHAGDDRLFGEGVVDVAGAITSGVSAGTAAGRGDWLQGMAGRDVIVGSNHQDILGGGSDKDLIVAGGGDDFITGDESYDASQRDWTFFVTHSGTTYTGNVNGGSQFGDGGTGDADVIHAGGGNDYVLGGTGDDLVQADDGDDIVFGEAGNDTLLGGDGNDLLDGGDPDEDIEGRDFLDGGAGNDILSGADGDDTLFGGIGDDQLSGDDGNEHDGNDYLDGEDGDDVLVGGGRDDLLFGGAGNDRLTGDSGGLDAELHGDDYLDGGIGNDILVGGGGQDTLIGGEGDDTLAGEGSDDPEEVHDDDYLDGGAGNDLLIGEGGADTLLGGDGDDQLFGESSTTPEDAQDGDFMDGGAGDDVMSGGGGEDTMLGGDGNDQMYGESTDTPESRHGADIMDGGAGDDVLVGEGGDDFLFGGDGDDQLFGESSSTPESVAGNDTLDGGAGNDTLSGSRGDDTLSGGTGNDRLFGGLGEDSLFGDDGDDRLNGNEGNDYLDGGEGRDIYGYSFGSGVDTIADFGGNTLQLNFSYLASGIMLGLGSLRLTFSSSPGDEIHLDGFDPDDPYNSVVIDRFEFTDRVMTYEEILALGFDFNGTPGEDRLDGTATADRINALGSDDVVIAKGGDDTIDGGDGDDLLSAGDGNDSVVGGAGNDSISGGAGADTLLGGVGNDVISAGEDNDTIDGGEGADLMRGNQGDDTFTVDSVADRVIEDSDEGNDTVRSSLTYTLTDNVENLVLTGTAALDGTGNDLDNRIDGNSASNRIDGGAGGDYMAGGGGNDTYVVDHYADYVDEGSNAGTDLVESSISYGLGYNVENLTLTGNGSTVGYGNDLDNIIVGNAGNNYLNGGLGNDTMRGGLGDDSYVVNSAGDTVIELADEGTDEVVSGVSYTLGANVENLVLQGLDMNGTGNDLANQIIGTFAINELRGLGGNDTLYGYDGNDLLDGGAGADTMDGGSGSDTYIVDNAGDVVIDAQFEFGVDVVNASVSYTLGANARIEEYNLTGNQAINVTGNQHTTEYFGNEAANVIVDLFGGDGLYGNGGNDTLIAGVGYNVLDGGTGVDHMEGGEDSDIYFVDETADTIVENLNAGYDEVVSTATYTLSANLESLYLQGAAAIDGTGNELGNYIFGNAAANIIRGLGGDDEIEGGDGNDVIEGGAGEDYIYADAGNDQVDGGDDDDYLVGGEGNDQIDGGNGDDLLFDNDGVNTLRGGAGSDTYLIGANLQSTIVELANAGIDTIVTESSLTLTDNVENLRLVNSYANQSVFRSGTGNSLDNSLTGNDYQNDLYGLDGADVIDGRAGNDFISGGEGNDTLFGGHDRAGWDSDSEVGDWLYFPHRNSDEIEGNAGNDNIDGGSGNDLLYGDEGDDYLFGGSDELVFGYGGGEGPSGYGYGSYLSNDDFLDGGIGNDVLDGGSGDDQLYGGAGNDNLFGGIVGPYNLSGDDMLDGGEGIDIMAGGSGNDTYFVDGTYVYVEDPTAVDECGVPIEGATRRVWTTDTIIEQEDAGYDTVYSYASIVLPDHFEEVHLEGGDNLDATSGAGAQQLYGNGANNRLDGGAGDDYMAGGLGDDTMVVRDAGDVVEEYQDEGVDTVEAAINFTLTANFENLTLIGSAVIGTGNDVANVLHGNAGNNQLYGLGGNDELNGGAGNDDLYGGDGDDVYRFGEGSGNDVVHDIVGFNTVRLLGDLTGADLTVTQSGNDLVVTLMATGETLTLLGWNSVTALSSGNLRLCVCGCPVNLNGTPIAQADEANVVEDTTLVATGNLLANDSDPDAGTTLSVVNAGAFSGNFGSLTIAADGSYTFTLNNAAVQTLAAGQTMNQVFNYTVSDNHATNPQTATSTLTVVVTGTNDAPVANDDTGSVAEDGALTATGNVLTNDTDIDQGTTLAVGNPGTFEGVFGTLTLGANGAFSYALDNASAEVQSLGQGETEIEIFGYTATDGALSDGAALSISVAGANDAPILVTPLQDQAATEGQAFTFAVPATAFTDIDRNDSLSYTATLSNGSALPSWLTFDAASRSFTGTAPTGSSGQYQVRVVATDLFGASANDVFAITVGSSTDDTLQYTVDGCWSDHYYSPGGFDLKGKNRTHSVYIGGAGTSTLVGTANNDTVLLEDECSPRPPGTSGARLVSIEIIDVGAGEDIVDLSSTLYSYGAVEVRGGDGDDVLVGGSGANTLRGDAGFDTLIGGSANDVLDGGTGIDYMEGGLGDDIYYVDNLEDYVKEEDASGIDTVVTSLSGIKLAWTIENLTLVGDAVVAEGNDSDNILTGNSGANLLIGGEGVDTLRGGAGDDVYVIGYRDESDVVVEQANEGIDEVQTMLSTVLGDNLENLTLVDTTRVSDQSGTGNALNNVIKGNADDNLLDGLGGSDTLIGGAGNDTYVVEGTADTVIESAGGGRDIVRSSGSFVLGDHIETLELTGTANINATGNAQDNLLIGNSGDNQFLFSAGFGHDTVRPGTSGFDSIVFDSTIAVSDVVVRVGSTDPRNLQIDVLLTGDRVTLEGFLADDPVAVRVDEVRFADGTTWSIANLLANFSRVIGTSGVDTLTAIPAGSLLYGREGNDVLNGGAGNDVLDGGLGRDTMSGGAGNDSYMVDDYYDVVTEGASGGTDTIYSSIDITLGNNIENVVMDYSDVKLTAIGNALDNNMRGSDGNNALDGGAGADTMIGAGGDDLYTVDNAGDVVIEAVDQGWDTVRSYISYSLGANLEDLELKGTANINATGNEYRNSMAGNSGNNTLDGGAEADYLAGGAGNDLYIVDNEGDKVTESSNQGTDTVQSSATFTLGANVENLILTGSANIDGTGNSAANVLTGNSGNNVLNGGNGADQMTGGAGDDTFVVNQATDQVFENAGEGIDTVKSAVTWTLGSAFEHLTLTGSTAINGFGNALDNILTGNSGANRLEGGAGADTLNGGSGADTLVGGTGDDIYFINSADDVVTEAAGEGFDIVNSSVSGNMAENIEVLFLTGSGNLTATGNALNNLIRGNSGANNLVGGAGVDVLEGGGGADILSDTSGSTFFNGGAGADTITGSSAADLFVGGAGNDSLITGGGADLILFNRGDGKDTIGATNASDDTLSLGGVTYADLLLKRSGNNLILLTGNSEQITFTDWYAGTGNRSVSQLQVVIEGTTDYLASSGDPLRNHAVQSFNFLGIVAAFDAALAATPGLSSWAVTNALTNFHLSGSDTAAVGGDLAYRYGRDHSFADISFNPALGVIGTPGFGSAAQGLLPLSSLQDASPRLGA